MGAVHPATAVGPDGAEYRDWRRAVSDALRWPWKFMTVDMSRPPAPPTAVEPFERLRAAANSSDPGCVAARKSLRVATLRGLAQATGRPMPPVKA